MDRSKEDKILEVMGVERLDHFEYESLDIIKSTEIASKHILVSINNELIVHDPVNMYIQVYKKEFDTDKVFLIPEEKFQKVYEALLSSSEKNITVAAEEESESDSLDNTEISKLLYQIFYAAKTRGASDIHILPKKEGTLVKFRIDGKLDLYMKYPLSYCPVLINKIKSESNMDQFEKRLPHDGKLKTTIGGDTMELRVSTLPTVYGENAVMRIVNTDDLFDLRLEDLGFEEEDLARYRRNFIEPYGMIINVGSTGAGKTTTFYLTLNELFQHFPTKNICTVEDPVEIKFEKALQVQVQENIGLTFPVVLKSLLRQDPDIILIGEMRDSDTAEIGIRSALTGHLVFSTLHAIDSFNAITRLRDLEISDTLISSTLSCLLSQRLARKLCSCREEYDIPGKVVEKYGLSFTKAYKPKGCSKCNNIGYKGRTAIIEVWEIDEDYKTSIAFGEGEVKLKMLAKEKDFQNLWKNGLKKVQSGALSIEELETIVKPDKILNSVGDLNELNELNEINK